MKLFIITITMFFVGCSGKKEFGIHRMHDINGTPTDNFYDDSGRIFIWIANSVPLAEEGGDSSNHYPTWPNHHWEYDVDKDRWIQTDTIPTLTISGTLITDGTLTIDSATLTPKK